MTTEEKNPMKEYERDGSLYYKQKMCYSHSLKRIFQHNNGIEI
jgi:hypothetical protein